jgi:hypothetical protein
MIRKAPLLFIALLIASSAAVFAEPAESYMFQTVLLVGSAEGKSDLSGVPANVVEALDDATKFLPYKNCRLIDVSLVRSNGDARALLNGPEGRDFELMFDFREDQSGTLQIRGFGIDTLVAQPQDRVVTENGKTKIEHDPPRWVRRNVIATSFTIEVGETIVVGTSKLNGTGEALIVLFTAMR